MIKGLQTMIRRLEAQIFRSQSQLEEIEKSLASGKIALQEYEIQKTRIQKQISECQSKLEDKSCKLQEKEQELEQMAKNIGRIGRVAQPFRNHKIDFEPPRITGKPPIFGVDKWIEEHNRSIASRFEKIVRQIRLKNCIGKMPNSRYSLCRIMRCWTIGKSNSYNRSMRD